MKKVKQHHPIRRKEYIFNIISLVLVIGIGIYFGIRSFYYYSKQNMKLKEEANSLVSYVLSNNKVAKAGDGVYQDENGYYFQGMVTNNYVKFANRIFRIVRIQEDNSVKLVSDDLVSQFMWGEDSSYSTSNLHSWLTKTKEEHSGVYYDTLPQVSKFLTETNYSLDTLLESKISKSKTKYKDFVTTLTLDDYIMAKGKNSYLNLGKYFWLLGYDPDEANLYVDESGNIQSGTSYDGYGVRAVITLKKDVKVMSGDGTVSNPYLISQGKDTNYVDQYVRLGNDIWKVYEDKGGLLRLSLNGYLSIQGTEYLSSYSKGSSLYNAADRSQLAYYLNHSYYQSLPYQLFLTDCGIYTGEVSNETGFSHLKTYQDGVFNKVGLLSIFDYNHNSNLDNYYFMNTTSSVGSIAYFYNQLGLLGEAKVTEKKHVVPTVCMNRTSVKEGEGTIENPYIVR